MAEASLLSGIGLGQVCDVLLVAEAVTNPYHHTTPPTLATGKCVVMANPSTLAFWYRFRSRAKSRIFFDRPRPLPGPILEEAKHRTRPSSIENENKKQITEPEDACVRALSLYLCIVSSVSQSILLSRPCLLLLGGRRRLSVLLLLAGPLLRLALLLFGPRARRGLQLHRRRLVVVVPP